MDQEDRLITQSRSFFAPTLAAILVVAGLAVFGQLPGCSRFDRELTIIVISLDTTRPDHLSAYGYDRDTTPTLARLAAEGTRFTEARSSTSWTLPGHMSLFTGMPVGVHDVVIDVQVLHPSRRTMGQIFQDADFRTMGFFSGPYLHGQFGFRRGMDFYERCIKPTVFEVPPEMRRSQLGLREAQSHQSVSSEDVVTKALTVMRTRRRPRNFVFMHFFDPHYDYKAPSRHVRSFANKGYRGDIDGSGLAREEIHDGTDLDEADREHMQALYDAELAWVDENIGQFLDALEAEGLLESTLIVVTGDHGEEFWENTRFGHRDGLRDEVLRVPLIIWGPGLGVPAGLVLDDNVALYDVLPTIMDYAGIDPASEPGIYGRSLRPLMTGGSLRAQPVAAALSAFPSEPDGSYTLHEALVHDGIKLIRRVDIEWSPENERNIGGQVLADTEQIEVYDLRADPGETRNLVESDDPADRERVEQALLAFQAERERQKQAAIALGGAPAMVLQTDDLSLMERMQAMGYTGTVAEERTTDSSGPDDAADDDDDEKDADSPEEDGDR